MAHWRRGNVDVKMALFLLAGGLVGSWLGVWLFSFLRSIGQIDLIIALTYVIFLGTLGSLMLMESIRTIARENRTKGSSRTRLHQHNWFHGLPLKTRFRRSKLYISALLPISIGMVVGVLTAIMGIGGGFIMVPAMNLLAGVPIKTAIGTSLAVIIPTALMGVTEHHRQGNVDWRIALWIALAASIGGFLGAKFAGSISPAVLKRTFGVMMVLVGARMALGK